MFNGYVGFGAGGEIINSERTEAYVAHQAPHLPFQPTVKSQNIHVAVEDKPYESPQIDDAPWFNPNQPETAGFFGLYPLEITGVGDSKLTAVVTESAGDGGSIGTSRVASRTIRVHGVLVGTDQLAAEAGLSWLRNRLSIEECSQSDPCGAGDFSYFVADPAICTVAWGDAEVAVAKESYGSHGVGTISRRWGTDEVDPTMPAHVIWRATAQPSTSFIYGAEERFGGTVLWESAPMTAARRNFVTNPTFRTGLAGWTAVNSGTLEWVQADGADSFGYAFLDGIDAAFVTGGSGIYGDGVYGDNVVYGGTSPLPTPGASYTVTDLPAGSFTASLALRADNDGGAVFRAVDVATGTVLAEQDVQVGLDWNRYTLTGTATGSVQIVVFSTIGLDIDQVLVEPGALAGAYFDGASVLEGQQAAWLGAPDASESTLGWTGIIEFTNPDSDFRPFIKILQGGLDNVTLEWGMRQRLEVADQLDPYARMFHNVRCTQGVAVISQTTPKSGGCFIEVDFLLAAGNPFAYSLPKTVGTVPLGTAPFADPDVPGPLDDAWLFDPNCLIPTPPPAAPQVVDDCLEKVSLWTRYYVAVPASDISLWASSVPTIGINSLNGSISQVRVRFHANPFNYPVDQVDPTAFCSEFIVSYLPAYTRLALNGMTQRASASKGGKAVVSADHLLYGSDGGPMLWPELTCGISYVMTIDVPRGVDLPSTLSVDLVVSTKE